jgi:hypothetical protein
MLFYSFQIMANNVIVETHYTQNMTRPSDPDNYQQCNYQTFQMLVHSVVDPLNSKRLNLNKYFNHFIYLS